MELLVFVMNKVDLLDELLMKFSEDSSGMAHILKDTNLFFGLRDLLNNSQVNSKTILMALDNKDIMTAVDIIESVVGNLENPDTGIVFTLPISYMKGMVKKG